MKKKNETRAFTARRTGRRTSTCFRARRTRFSSGRTRTFTNCEARGTSRVRFNDARWWTGYTTKSFPRYSPSIPASSPSTTTKTTTFLTSHSRLSKPPRSRRVARSGGRSPRCWRARSSSRARCARRAARATRTISPRESSKDRPAAFRSSVCVPGWTCSTTATTPNRASSRASIKTRAIPRRTISRPSATLFRGFLCPTTPNR